MPGQQRTRRSTATASNAKVSVKVSPIGLGVIGLLLIGVLGYVGYVFATRGNSDVSVVAPSATANAPSSAKTVVQEDFSTLNAWLFKVTNGKDYRIALQNGEMVLDVSGTALHNYYTGEFGAMTAEVDARVIDGTDNLNSRFGLVFKKTNDTAYHFEYYPYQNGLWTLQLGKNDVFTSLAKGNAPGRAPTAFTRLKVEINGNRAKLFVNGSSVGEADVSAAPRGQVGVSATSDKGKNIRMAFDNFSIRE